jgi:DNA-binding SARP family transcriptional activator
MLQICLFGSARLVFAGAPLKFGALPKTTPLLAYLLWPDVPESAARGNLRRHLHDLRPILPPATHPGC